MARPRLLKLFVSALACLFVTLVSARGFATPPYKQFPRFEQVGEGVFASGNLRNWVNVDPTNTLASNIAFDHSLHMIRAGVPVEGANAASLAGLDAAMGAERYSKQGLRYFFFGGHYEDATDTYKPAFLNGKRWNAEAGHFNRSTLHVGTPEEVATSLGEHIPSGGRVVNVLAACGSGKMGIPLDANETWLVLDKAWNAINPYAPESDLVPGRMIKTPSGKLILKGGQEVALTRSQVDFLVHNGVSRFERLTGIDIFEPRSPVIRRIFRGVQMNWARLEINYPKTAWTIRNGGPLLAGVAAGWLVERGVTALTGNPLLGNISGQLSGAGGAYIADLLIRHLVIGEASVTMGIGAQLLWSVPSAIITAVVVHWQFTSTFIKGPLEKLMADNPDDPELKKLHDELSWGWWIGSEIYGAKQWASHPWQTAKDSWNLVWGYSQ